MSPPTDDSLRGDASSDCTQTDVRRAHAFDPLVADESDDPCDEEASWNDGMPLQKWLQWQGAGSRNQVRKAIADGRVTCDGDPVTRFAHPIRPGIEVRIDDAPVADNRQRVVLLLHKPRKHLTALHTDDGTPHLGPYVPPDLPRVFCVGRLDFNTEGALLLTNDGALARRVLDPATHLPKLYRVKVRDHLAADDPGFARIRAGLRANGVTYRPAAVAIERYRTRATWIRIVLTEGRFREIRFMCAENRWQIVKLQRVAIGNVELGDLRARCVRTLEPAELAGLEALISRCESGQPPDELVEAWLGGLPLEPSLPPPRD